MPAVQPLSIPFACSSSILHTLLSFLTRLPQCRAMATRSATLLRDVSKGLTDFESQVRFHICWAGSSHLRLSF